MGEAVIDAGAMLDERERRRAGDEREKRGSEAELGDSEQKLEVAGARGRAALKSERRPWPAGARTLFVAVGTVAAVIMGALLWKARDVRAEDVSRREAARPVERVERHVPKLELATSERERVAPGRPARAPGEPPMSNGPASAAAGGGRVADSERPGPTDAQALEQRRLSRGFGGDDGSGAAVDQAPAPLGATARAAGGFQGSKPGGSVEEKLEPVELKAASAGILPDRDLLLTQGAMLDCVLETKLVSTVPGMTSCHLTRNVYSANGRVVLLDRGSKVVGRYQGGLQQGEARIFVVWTRVETPNGVVVELQSPGTGPLGEAGVDGFIDTHFWDRFGAAILLSIIQDGADAAAARAAGPQSTGITFTNQAAASKDVVARSLDPTINIPPTLVKNQGERLGIFVARDLDFRSVYGLERVASAER